MSSPLSRVTRWRRLRGRPLLFVSTLLSALLPALWLLEHGYDKRWAGDDGLINVRVVQQLMAGNGFVYNAGERVEAVTSAAWVLMLWLVGELGFDVSKAAWVLSLGFNAVGLFMAALAVARVRARDAQPGTVVLPVGVLAYAAIPVAWEYATSALEHGLGVGFLGIAYYLVARVATSERGRGSLAAALFCGLLPLVRPDFALFGAPLIVFILVVAQGWRARITIAACAALPGVAFEIFRMGYFACLVPNTALAKTAFGARWELGYWYLDDMMQSYRLSFPLAAAAIVLATFVTRIRPARSSLPALLPIVMAGAGALHLLYIVRVGGDFMHGRLVLPGLFGIFAGAAVMHVPLARATSGEPQTSRTWGVMATALLLATFLLNLSFGVYCADHLAFLPSAATVAAGINDERRFYVENAGHPHPTRYSHYRNHFFALGPLSIRRRIAERCPMGDAALQDESRVACPRFALPDGVEGVLNDQPPDVLLPLEPSSAAPFVLGVLGFRPLGISGVGVGLRINVIDGYGLVDSLASRLELSERGRPGHEARLSTWWFAAKYLAEGVTHDPRALAARHVLRCGLVAELQAATHEPLTLSRFLRNVQLSYSLHRLRIPADPLEAERKFCS
jgi:arabinofuranosyltransferase